MPRYTVEVEYQDDDGSAVIEQVEVDADDEYYASDMAMVLVEDWLPDDNDVEHIEVNSVKLTG